MAPLLSLAGKALRLGETALQVGVPQVRGLVSATALRCRLVVIKVSKVDAENLTPERFAVARKQHTDLGLSEQTVLTLPTRSDGQPSRRTLRVQHREIVGYEVVIEALTADESLIVQSEGLGLAVSLFSAQEKHPGRGELGAGCHRVEPVARKPKLSHLL